MRSVLIYTGTARKPFRINECIPGTSDALPWKALPEAWRIGPAKLNSTFHFLSDCARSGEHGEPVGPALADPDISDGWHSSAHISVMARVHKRHIRSRMYGRSRDPSKCNPILLIGGSPCTNIELQPILSVSEQAKTLRKRGAFIKMTPIASQRPERNPASISRRCLSCCQEELPLRTRSHRVDE